MSVLPKSIQNLISEFSKLPSIGPKSAQRLTFYLLKLPSIDLEKFAQAVAGLQKDVVYCNNCFNMSETDPCKICSDPKRDKNLILVVEDPLDVVAMDQIENFEGQYHVLGGVISPLDGVGPENLKIKELLTRLSNPSQKMEVVLATNPSMEGEATAMYIAKQLKHPEYAHVKATRLGRGLPMGADLEYADEFTLLKSLEGRQEI
jgi:recombination protein RecR